MCILINAHVCVCVHICACMEGRGGHQVLHAITVTLAVTCAAVNRKLRGTSCVHLPQPSYCVAAGIQT